MEFHFLLYTFCFYWFINIFLVSKVFFQLAFNTDCKIISATHFLLLYHVFHFILIFPSFCVLDWLFILNGWSRILLHLDIIIEVKVAKNIRIISIISRNSNFILCPFREEFAVQNCIMQSGAPVLPSSTLAVPVSSSASAHTENTALLADIRTIKINPS